MTAAKVLKKKSNWMNMVVLYNLKTKIRKFQDVRLHTVDRPDRAQSWFENCSPNKTNEYYT